MNLETFVEIWNVDHMRFTYGLQMLPVVGKPSNIELRYPAAKHQEVLTAQNWDRLCALVEANSKGTMFVSTGIKLFERGIVGIQVASQNHNYSDRIAKGTLRRIAEIYGVPTDSLHDVLEKEDEADTIELVRGWDLG